MSGINQKQIALSYQGFSGKVSARQGGRSVIAAKGEQGSLGRSPRIVAADNASHPPGNP